MKRLPALFASLLVGAALVACSGPGVTAAPSAPTVKTTISAVQQYAGSNVGDTIIYTQSSFRTPADASKLTPCSDAKSMQLFSTPQNAGEAPQYGGTYTSPGPYKALFISPAAGCNVNVGDSIAITIITGNAGGQTNVSVNGWVVFTPSGGTAKLMVVDLNTGASQAVTVSG